MRILVTGGAGFIGSHVVDAYLKAGHEVWVLDDLSTGRREHVDPRARLVVGDIRGELGPLMAAARPQAINHHAAQKSVPASVTDPLRDAEINVLGLVNVLEAARAVGVTRFILASTGGALAGERLPAREEDAPILVSPYAVSKLAGEHYLDAYATMHGIETVALRYANVYGPRQTPDGESGVVPIFMENLRAGRPSRLYAFADMPGGATRDWVHVHDVARANLLALGSGQGAFHIGSGREVPTRRLYELIEAVAGRSAPLVPAGERAGDLRRSVLDIRRARAVLGWEPAIPLQAGLAATWAWVAGIRG